MAMTLETNPGALPREQLLTDLDTDVLLRNDIRILAYYDDVENLIPRIMSSPIIPVTRLDGTRSVRHIDKYEFHDMKARISNDEDQEVFDLIVGIIGGRHSLALRQTKSFNEEVDVFHIDTIVSTILTGLWPTQYLVDPEIPNRFRGLIKTAGSVIKNPEEIESRYVFTAPIGAHVQHGPDVVHRRHPYAVRDQRHSIKTY